MSLFGEISLDPSKANRAIDNVKAKAGGLDSALTKIGNSFGNKFLALFSAGTAIAAIRKLTAEVEDIQQLATSLGISTRQVQQLQEYAKETSQSFSEMTSSAEKMEEALSRASGRDVKFSQGNIQKVGMLDGIGGSVIGNFIEMAKNDIASRFALFTGGSKEGARADLFGDDTEEDRRIMDAREEQMRIMRKKKADEERQWREDIAFVEEHRKAADAEAARQFNEGRKEAQRANRAQGDALNDELGIVGKRGLPSDSLRSVGNFLGSSPAGIMQQQNSTLKEMKSLLQAIKENTKDGLGL